jgi:anti-sigma B factor antagonist
MASLEGPPFSIEIDRSRDGAWVLLVTGEVDPHTAPDLDGCLRECETDGVTQVVVDFTESTLLDSTGLGVLIAAQGRLEERGVELKVAGANRVVGHVFGVTGLDRVFQLHASTAAALDGDGAVPHNPPS